MNRLHEIPGDLLAAQGTLPLQRQYKQIRIALPERFEQWITQSTIGVRSERLIMGKCRKGHETEVTLEVRAQLTNAGGRCLNHNR